MLAKIRIPFIFAGAILLLVAGCKKYQNETKVQFMPDMADAPTVKAQESYLNPPDHSMQIGGNIYPDDWAVAEKEFVNPFQPGFGNYDEVLKDGQIHFETFCSVCHGKDGKGQGYLGVSYPIAVPDITRDELKTRGDGFYFMKISKGGAMMPSYGHAIDPLERWQIVSYIRKLQNQ